MNNRNTYERHIQNKSPSPSLQDTNSMDGEYSLSISMDTRGDSNYSTLSRDNGNMGRSRNNDPNLSYIGNKDFVQGRNNNSDNSGIRNFNNGERSSSRNKDRSKSEKELLLKKLRQHYELANERAVRLANSNIDSEAIDNTTSEAQQSGANTYSALSALLYATISVAKIDVLETYVKSRGKQLPTQLFDMNEWEPILSQAKSFRKSELLSLSSSPMKGSQSADYKGSTGTAPVDKQHVGDGDQNQSVERELAKLKENMREEKSSLQKQIGQLQHSLSSLSTNYKLLKDENDRLREEVDMERLRADSSVQSSKQPVVDAPARHNISTYERTISQLREALAEKTEELLKKSSVIDSKDVTIKELRDNLDEAKKLGPSYTINPETLDLVSQQAISVVSSSIKTSVVKVTANEVENKLSDTPENIINDLLNELQITKNRLNDMQNELQDVSKFSIPSGSRCTMRYLPNNQSDQQCKIEIKAMTNPSSCTEIVVDAEQFKDAYLTGRANDYVLQLNIDQPSKSSQHRENDTTAFQLEKEKEQLSAEISILSQRLSDQEKKLHEQETMLAELKTTNAELQSCSKQLNQQQAQALSSHMAGEVRSGTADDKIKTLNGRLVLLQNENMQLRRKLNPAKDLVVPSLQNEEGKLKVAITVQKIARGFLGRVRYLRRVLERQGNPDKLLACAGTKQGQTGWYIKDDNAYYYFCRSDHKFIQLCGPLSKSDYMSARNEALGAEKRYKIMVNIDISAIFACKAQLEAVGPVGNRRHSKSKQEQQNQVHFPATAVINDLDKKVDELTRDLNLEKRSVRRRSISFTNYGSGKLSPRMRNKHIVLIQTRVRMLLAALRVGRIRCAKFGHLENDYVAMPHTKPGTSGWYIKGNKCYYMAARRALSVSTKSKTRLSREAQLVKVLGPIDKAAHNKAVESNKKMSVGDERIFLDYSCVIALENSLQEVNEKLEDIKKEQQQRFMTGPSPEVQAQLKSYVSEIRKLREQLKANSKLKESLLDIESNPPKLSKVVKVQSVVRKFMARCRVSTKRLAKLASEQGILVATVRNRQGESGWYIAPDGSYYYFALNKKEWNVVAGPVSPEAYIAMITKTRVINMKSSELKSGDQLIPLSSDITSNVKTAFEVRNIDKKLFINTATNDIFICAPISVSFLMNYGNTRNCPFCAVGTSVSEASERNKITFYFSERNKRAATDAKQENVASSTATGGGIVRKSRTSNIKLPKLQPQRQLQTHQEIETQIPSI